MKRFLVMAILLPLFCNSICAVGVRKVRRKAPPVPEFALAAGEKYEGIGEWDKAEEQYLKAGANATPAIQQKSLVGVIRVRQKLKQQRWQAACLLEQQERWQAAEQSYLDLLRTDPDAGQEVAAALERLQPHLRGPRRAEAFDELAANIGRVFLVFALLVTIPILIYAITRARGSIQLVPFTASEDDSAKRIAFWLQLARGELKSATSPLSAPPGGSPRIAGNVGFGLVFGRAELQEESIEPPELEVGGIKLPLKQLLQLVALPRVRVSGSWLCGPATGNAYAEVERRRWTEFTLDSVICRTVTSSPGEAQDRDLRVFAYDVLMKARTAYER